MPPSGEPSYKYTLCKIVLPAGGRRWQQNMDNLEISLATILHILTTIKKQLVEF